MDFLSRLGLKAVPFVEPNHGAAEALPAQVSSTLTVNTSVDPEASPRSALEPTLQFEGNQFSAKCFIVKPGYSVAVSENTSTALIMLKRGTIRIAQIMTDFEVAINGDEEADPDGYTRLGPGKHDLFPEADGSFPGNFSLIAVY